MNSGRDCAAGSTAGSISYTRQLNKRHAVALGEREKHNLQVSHPNLSITQFYPCVKGFLGTDTAASQRPRSSGDEKRSTNPSHQGGTEIKVEAEVKFSETVSFSAGTDRIGPRRGLNMRKRPKTGTQAC